MPAPVIPLDQQLCFSLYATSIAINRTYKPLLDGLGVTYPQYLVLSALWENDGQTISAIGERLALEPSTITPLVKRLEQAGFIARQRNPADERQVVVSLTAQGKALRAESGCLTETLLQRSGLSVEQIVDLNDRVRALNKALTEHMPD
ncbi:MarR family transcriptional regulator [Bradyrhizobium sp. U87765 SZCCT0131]|uniref:MarR family winged helix-turn-helix transcriptional regulator n=1 Tax=unclassified Bradyrhizobium TaxID=2631580 RepID=UPI001BAB67C6|nr:MULTISPECIES: MarR family transcriptional regulator [unclassified Bradyrhizobium]MBR1219040.1 MarR family transcriptional regulator [Bradyrhizobium sp. U87765 SZCCT0131]MBR1261691.1 MarR family transcriptional regulator [Bradyrhizobium sp. U87765 SZCCT0134]MBR1306456.1 MarR family transcriptional regulator [Bradyrhizobium sp. U87765 SZCCT0110]MBR1317473.1 MarR family transcriptional regulator [Bradyrhizobium sp. U87765 SZCCT0109]MBR1351175.1 MarR family transcriptional regulator [Bradyrhizo